jgi:Predicted Fe-S-cluster redox enzyme
MTNLLNLTLPELESWLQDELGERKFRAMPQRTHRSHCTSQYQ